MKKCYLTTFLILILAIVLDQYTKFLAVTHLQDAPVVIIDGVFELRYLENRGAAFGILQNQQLFFVFSGILMLVVLTLLYFRLPNHKRYIPLRICMIAISAGAVGNMIDRIRLNYVIDFFYFKLIDFPIFNVADIYVSVSACALILLLLFFYKEKEIDAIFEQLSWKSFKK